MPNFFFLPKQSAVTTVAVTHAITRVISIQTNKQRHLWTILEEKDWPKKPAGDRVCRFPEGSAGCALLGQATTITSPPQQHPCQGLVQLGESRWEELLDCPRSCYWNGSNETLSRCRPTPWRWEEPQRQLHCEHHLRAEKAESRACQKQDIRQTSGSFNRSSTGCLLRAHLFFQSSPRQKHFTAQTFNCPPSPLPKHQTKKKPTNLQAQKFVCSQCPAPCPVTFCPKCHWTTCVPEADWLSEG